VEPVFQKLDQVLAGVALAPPRLLVDAGWLDRKESPLTERGKITERFHRINYGHMEVRVTVTDPKAYTHPFTVTLNEYVEPTMELIDFVCLENNTDQPHVVGK